MDRRRWREYTSRVTTCSFAKRSEQEKSKRGSDSFSDLRLRERKSHCPLFPLAGSRRAASSTLYPTGSFPASLYSVRRPVAVPGCARTEEGRQGGQRIASMREKSFPVSVSCIRELRGAGYYDRRNVSKNSLECRVQAPSATFVVFCCLSFVFFSLPFSPALVVYPA